MQIKPISELSTHCDEIVEEIVNSREPAIFTREGYGEFIMMSLHEYEQKMQAMQTWAILKETEMRENSMEYLTHEQVFSELKTFLDERKTYA